MRRTIHDTIKQVDKQEDLAHELPKTEALGLPTVP